MDYFQFVNELHLRRPVLIAAFAGWNDAAQIATSAVEFLADAWKADEVARIDPEEFYDFSEQRPIARLNPQGERRIEWPANVFYARANEEWPKDFLLLKGIEPQLRWRTFSEAIMALARHWDVSEVILLGGLLAPVPHTRAPRVTGTAQEATLRQRLRAVGAVASRYQGPTGIVGVLSDACRKAELPCASLWGSVPHYIAAMPNPRVALALLAALNEAYDLRLNLDGLRREAIGFEIRVNEAISQNPEAAEFVRRLEAGEAEEEPEEKAAPEAALPPGDEVVRELEEFLRRQREGGES
jgi:predicted ATP-grasp superfamily ATP-dependent carboligase